MPSCGGSQWLRTMRSSAALRVEAMGSCGGNLIFTESVIGLASLRAVIVLEPESDLAETSSSRIVSSARFPGI